MGALTGKGQIKTQSQLRDGRNIWIRSLITREGAHHDVKVTCESTNLMVVAVIWSPLSVQHFGYFKTCVVAVGFINIYTDCAHKGVD